MRSRNRLSSGMAVAVTVALFLASSIPAAASPRTRLPGKAKSSITCPTTLPPYSTAAAGVVAGVEQDMPALYNRAPKHGTYQISGMGSLSPAVQPAGVRSFFGTPYHGIAAHLCGAAVANRSWVVFLFFPKLKWSASLSQGVVFVARTTAGWHVWYTYD